MDNKNNIDFTNGPDFATLAKTIQENIKPEIKSIKELEQGDGQLAIIPKGMELHSLQKFVDENREYPKRRKGTIETTRMESFKKIVQRFKGESSILFANCSVSSNSIRAGVKAVFNYHPADNDSFNADNADHKASYSFPLSRDFKVWLEQNQTPMTQIDFALFLEERVNDMAAPTDADKSQVSGLKPKFADPLEILELSRNLEIYSNEAFVSKNKLSSGETELKFTNQHVDGSGKPISIPDFFVIQIPVFDGGEPFRILSRLRYRKKDNCVVWFFDMYRIDTVLNDSFESTCETLSKELDLVLIHGDQE